MIGDAPLMLREYVMNEPLPLATIHAAVFDFLRGRDDCVIYGAQAVNAHVEESRATEDIDLAAIDAPGLAEAIRHELDQRLKIAVRVRSVRDGIGYRVYQLRKPKNRHLIDIRPVKELPPRIKVDGLPVISPAESIANKVASLHARGHKKKGFTDARDLTVMLLSHPELKQFEGPVSERLQANEVDPEVFTLWREWVDRVIEPEDEDDEFDY